MFTQFSIYGFLLLQHEVGFDMVSMWNQMGFAARAVVIIMFLMSARPPPAPGHRRRPAGPRRRT